MKVSAVEIYKEIKADNVKSALFKAQNLSVEKEKKNLIAYNILKALNEYIYQLNQTKSNFTSDPFDIYELTRFSCDILSDGWNCKQLTFMQCLYHIIRFLLSSHPNLSRNLCEYYFKLKKGDKVNSWDEQESLVLLNIIHNFLNKLNESHTIVCTDIFEGKETSLDSWIHFIIRLFALHNFEKIFKLFTVFSNLLTELRETTNHETYIQFGEFCLSTLADLFEKTYKNKLKINITDKDYTSFVSFLDFCIFYLNDNELLNIRGENVLNCISRFKKITSCDCRSLDILEKCFNLCLERDENLIKKLEEICDLLITNSWSSKDTDILFMMSSLLFKFRSNLVKSFVTKDSLLQILKFVITLNKLNSNNLSSVRKITDFINVLYTGFYFVSSQSHDKETLDGIFKDVKILFKMYTNLSVNVTVKPNSLAFAVSGVVNVILTYRKKEMFEEMASLSVSVLKYLQTLSPTVILGIKNYVECVISSLAFSFAKICCIIDAQIALIAFVSVHKDFHSVIFKSWAELKNTDLNATKYEKITVVTVLNENGKTMEETWPPFKSEDVDINMLLYWEISCYSKIRSLHQEPVLSAYVTAAKLVKDDFKLAAILISSVDALTSDTILAKITNFEKSLNNVAQLLKKSQISADPEHLAIVNCLLGNIFYQLLRCEIVQLRKKTEDEVLLLDMKSQRDVPILQADQGDELDDCSFAPAFKYLKLSAQSSILEKMEKSLVYWGKSVDSLQKSDIISPSLHYMKAMGYLFRLYKYQTKELQLWELLYKIAMKLSNFKYKVLAVSELLTLKKSVDKKLIEEIKRELESDSEITSKSYVYQIFYVNLAKHKFNNGLIKDCTDILLNLDENRLKYNFLVYIQYKILMTFVDWQCLESMTGFKESSVYPIVKIFENLLYIVKYKKWNTFCELSILHWLLLETSLLLGNIYNDLQYVRHARCYTKNQLAVAQRLALPLRVCELLSVLTCVDLHCWNSDDCNLKLRGMETILDLEAIDMEIEINDRPSSPQLMEKIHCTPHFLQTDNCSCQFCENIDYQIQALNAVTLRAYSLLSNSPYSLAASVFKIGHEVIKHLERKSKTYKHLFLYTPESTIRFYMALSRAHVIWGNYDEALHYNRASLGVLGKCFFKNPTLEFCLKQQKHCIVWKQNYISVNVCNENPKKRNVNTLPEVKTPEHSMLPTKLVTPPKTTKLPITPRPFHRRKLVLDDYESEDHSGDLEEKDVVPLIFDNGHDFLSVANVKPIKTYKGGKNNLLKEPTTSNIKPMHTPANNSRSERKAQTEKKATTKKSEVDNFTNLLFCAAKSKPAIKIYCDDENEKPTINKKRTKAESSKRHLLQGAPPSTVKKPPRSVAKKNISSETNEEFKCPPSFEVRKLTFEINDDSDDDIQLVSVHNKNSSIKTKTKEELIDLTDDSPLKSQTSETPLAIKRTSSDESYIEGTPPSSSNNQISKTHIDLTPQTLGEHFSKLTLKSKCGTVSKIKSKSKSDTLVVPMQITTRSRNQL